MGLRFFADHCVSNSIVHALREAGHEVLMLREYLPVESPDAAVIAEAQRQDAILLSLDGDFADIVTYPPTNYQGLVALQVRNHPEVIPQYMQRLLGYIASHPDRDHYRGKLLLVEIHRIRLR